MIKKIINLFSGIAVPVYLAMSLNSLIKDRSLAQAKDIFVVMIFFLVIYIGSGGDEKYKYMKPGKRVLRMLVFPIPVFFVVATVICIIEKEIGYSILCGIISLLTVSIYFGFFNTVSDVSKEMIDDMDGYEFERFCAEVLERNGYTDVNVTPGSGDFGADITAYKGANKWVIQCKRYTWPVGEKAIQEVVASKSYYKASKAAVITNSTFTAAAKKLAQVNDVQLFDGKELEGMQRR